MKGIVIPIPTAVSDDVTDRVKHRAADRYGGFTVLEAQGGWVAPNGETVTEPVEVLTVLADDEDGTVKPQHWAKATARHIKAESDEQSVMWFVRQIAAGGFE